MSKAQYFIEVDTYWQNSKSYFVGPFDSREVAEAWHQNDEWVPADNTWLSTSQCGGDISSAWRIFPAALSKTEARTRGLRRYSDGDSYDNEIPTHTKCQARALSNATFEEVY